MEAMKMNKTKFPEAIPKTFKLDDGRRITYYTFAVPQESSTTPQQSHPVLYLHGFPGSGIEGGLCAESVTKMGGQLFSMDRPGLGDTDKLPAGLNEDERVKGAIEDIWQLVRHKQWESFSVIGVSGGCPFALALLQSFLDRTNNNSNQTTPMAQLSAVSVVGGACFSAGIEGITPPNAAIYTLSTTPKNSWLYRLAHAQLFFMCWMMGISARLLPERWFLKLATSDKELPEADKQVLIPGSEGSQVFIADICQSMKRGPRGPYLECLSTFRGKYAWEDALKQQVATSLVPVGIFHAREDRNVPFSHAQYVHKEVLKEKSKLYAYSGLGHISLVIEKADDYCKFAVTGNL